MNKLLIFIISLFACTHHFVYAQEVKKVDIPFLQKDFRIIEDADGITHIASNNITVFGENLNSAALPFYPVNVCVPVQKRYAGVSFNGWPETIRENVIMAANSLPVKTSLEKGQADPNIHSGYLEGEYPSEKVIFKGESVCGEYRILTFAVCPFVYDSRSMVLAFTENMSLNIELKQAENLSENINCNSISHNILKEICYNTEDIAEREPEVMLSKSSVPVEYVIITRDSLVNAFQPLANWKKQKGVNSQIVTIESIISNYSGGTIQQKIKRCLRDYYSQGLKYALLGGDSNIVPVQLCALYVFKEIENSVFDYVLDNNDMPTDLYYACFDGDFYWNANGNDSIGEADDNVSMYPSIYVTRASVRTSTDVNAFVSKVLFYEQTPTANGWGNNMLACGSMLENPYIFDPTKSDAEVVGNVLYQDYIQPYWSGTRYKFYDTNTSFTGGASYPLDKSHLSDQLSQGYTFVQMLSHGQVQYWALENFVDHGITPSSTTVYSSEDAMEQTNSRPTIMTTIACLTNSFDDVDACFSERVMNNPNNNVVAYLGCSKEGWVDSIQAKYGVLTMSLLYEAEYYKKLFLPETEKKSFGRIVAEAKAQMIGASLSDGFNRWIQYGLNPLGDPEMPIFTDTPQTFDNAELTMMNFGFVVNAGVSGSTICIMSSQDNGNSYYRIERDTISASFIDVDTDVSICITKPGYIPKIFELKNELYIQNDTLTTSKDIIAQKIHIGSNVTTTMPSGLVHFENGTYNIKGCSVTLHPGTCINRGSTVRISK